MEKRTSLTKTELVVVAGKAGFNEWVEDAVGNLFAKPIASPLDLSRKYYGSCITVYGDLLHEQGFLDPTRRTLVISSLSINRRKKGAITIWDGKK